MCVCVLMAFLHTLHNPLISRLVLGASEEEKKNTVRKDRRRPRRGLVLVRSAWRRHDDRHRATHCMVFLFPYAICMDDDALRSSLRPPCWGTERTVAIDLLCSASAWQSSQQRKEGRKERGLPGRFDRVVHPHTHTNTHTAGPMHACPDDR